MKSRIASLLLRRISLLLPAALVCAIAFSCMDRSSPAEDGAVRVVLPGSSRAVSGSANADSYKVSLLKGGTNIDSQTAAPGGAVEFDGLDAGDYSVDVEATLSGSLSGVGSADVHVDEGETASCSILMSRVYTAAAAAKYIESLSAGSYKVIVAGEIDDEGIQKINENLTKNTNAPLISLDLGRTTGLAKLSMTAFSNCAGLTGIKLPEGITEIGASAFRSTGLASITLPSTVTEINSFAFSDCEKLEVIKIPSGVTEISSSAFKNCKGLKSIELPDSITSIGSEMFYGCESLKSVKIPAGVTSIGGNVFEGCSALESIVLPDSITSIGASAFKNCTSLASIVLPDNITSMGTSVFYGCKKLASVTLPSKITKIENSAFEDCISLTSIVIPDEVDTISSRAFYNCYSLKNITIPFKVTLIGASAFTLCSALNSESGVVIYKGTQSDWDGITIEANNPAFKVGSKATVKGSDGNTITPNS